MIGRIIGFSETQACFAHPLFHAALRRDCDGDENCVMLLMDGLLNFSRQFLPDKRGSRTMDSPLVLTSKLIPAEVDDMVQGLDVAWGYPAELYYAAKEFRFPPEVRIEQLKKRLNTELQYEKIGFTHNVSSINIGVKCSAYKTLPSMEDKLKGQMDIAEKVRAVDEKDVARLVIEKHFIRDIKGNLRKFSQQEFRCVKCNEKFRRPPLVGKCIKCGGKLLFTIAEGSVLKYLEPTISLANKYDLSVYLKQTLELTKLRIEGVFGKDSEKQAGLGAWFG
jgi:DNA polymerase II large subunit